MKIAALITAGGNSSRMNSTNKLFSFISGKPVIVRSIEAIEKSPYVTSIFIASQTEKIPYLSSLCISHGLKKIQKILPGGTTRQESVYNMLASLNENYDFIAIHDGARPLISQEDLNELFIKCPQYSAGVILASPPADTIKLLEPDGFIISTPERAALAAAQTPQVFPAELIKSAHKKALKENFNGTDDSSLVERLGYKVAIIKAKRPNIKITYQEDLAFCEVLLNG